MVFRSSGHMVLLMLAVFHSASVVYAGPPEWRPQLTVVVVRAADGISIAGADVTIQDNWGYWSSPNTVRRTTDREGHAVFRCKDFDGWGMYSDRTVFQCGVGEGPDSSQLKIRVAVKSPGMYQVGTAETELRDEQRFITIQMATEGRVGGDTPQRDQSSLQARPSSVTGPIWTKPPAGDYGGLEAADFKGAARVRVRGQRPERMLSEQTFFVFIFDEAARKLVPVVAIFTDESGRFSGVRLPVGRKLYVCWAKDGEAIGGGEKACLPNSAIFVTPSLDMVDYLDLCF